MVNGLFMPVILSPRLVRAGRDFPSGPLLFRPLSALTLRYSEIHASVEGDQAVAGRRIDSPEGGRIDVRVDAGSAIGRPLGLVEQVDHVRAEGEGGPLRDAEKLVGSGVEAELTRTPELRQI